MRPPPRRERQVLERVFPFPIFRGHPVSAFINKFLKTQYVDPGKMQSVGDRAAPFVAACDKPIRAGEAIAEPVIISGPKGNSYSFTAAQAVAAQSDHGASNYDRFISGYGRYYGVVNIDDMAVSGSKEKNYAFLKLTNE